MGYPKLIILAKFALTHLTKNVNSTNSAKNTQFFLLVMEILFSMV